MRYALIPLLILSLATAHFAFFFEAPTVHAAVRVNRLGISGKTYFASTVNPPNLQNGLVGHWTFDGKDMKPNARDRSGQGNHGSLFNFAATNTKAGKVGQALSFDGTNDVVRMGDVLDDVLMATSSYCAWARPTGTTAQSGYIFGKFTAPTENSWFFRRNGNSQWWFSTASYDASLTATLTLEVWQHMCVVYAPTPNTSYLYRDGVLVDTTTTMPAVFNNPSQVMIGDRDSGDRPFAGEIDDARLYNRALSASEIAQIYKLATGSHQSTTNTPTNLQSGLIGHWTFDGKDMRPNVRDVSGSGNHGQLAGFTSTTTFPGKFGQALDLNGSTNYVVANSFPALSDFTMSVWFKLDTVPGGEIELVSKATNVRSLGVLGGNLLGYVGPSTNMNAGAIQANRWYMGTLVSSSTNSHALYLNGLLVGTNAVAYGSDSSNALWIGGLSGQVRWTDGVVDDARVYNRALSPTEVLQLYNLGR